MKILNQIIILFFLIPIVSLGQDLVLKYNSNKVKKEIRRIVKKIEKMNQIHTEAIGYSGERTNQYKRFEKLLKKATIEEFLELMNYPNPVVRGYTFWALAKRYYGNLEEIFVAHANDEESVFHIQGCFPVDLPLIEFMSWVVRPQMLDINCKKLNKEAFTRMYQKNKGIYKNN